MTEYPGCSIYGGPPFRFDGKNTYSFVTPIANLAYGWSGVLDNYFDYFKEAIPYSSSSVVILKKSLIEIGGFPEDIRYMEDADAWARMGLSYDAAYLNIPLSIYHKEAENRTVHNNSELLKVINKWQLLVTNGKIPEKYAGSFYEFLVRYRIMAIRQYINQGDYKKARGMLGQILDSKVYHDQVLRLKNEVFSPPILTKTYNLTKKILSKVKNIF